MEVTFKGGPYDGETRMVYGAVLKVATGWDAGWKHACGHESMAWGQYDRTGAWTEPQNGLVFDDPCPTCRTVKGF